MLGEGVLYKIDIVFSFFFIHRVDSVPVLVIYLIQLVFCDIFLKLLLMFFQVCLWLLLLIILQLIVLLHHSRRCRSLYLSSWFWLRMNSIVCYFKNLGKWLHLLFFFFLELIFLFGNFGLFEFLLKQRLLLSTHY